MKRHVAIVALAAAAAMTATLGAGGQKGGGNKVTGEYPAEIRSDERLLASIPTGPSSDVLTRQAVFGQLAGRDRGLPSHLYSLKTRHHLRLPPGRRNLCRNGRRSSRSPRCERTVGGLLDSNVIKCRRQHDCESGAFSQVREVSIPRETM